jgi:hypothetical protein
MGVLKSKRSLSDLEFYHTARKMRRELTELLLRDFGIHSRKHFNVENEEGYYDELLEEFAQNMRQLLRNMMLNITAANTIYPVSQDELTLRRRYQTGALINCEQLHQEILYCQDVLPVKASVFVPYVEQIELEIKLLKGWRKSNNKLAEQIANKLKKEEEAKLSSK